MNSCMTCGRLIMEPGITYGYAGPVCQCIVEPKIQRPMNNQNVTQLKPLMSLEQFNQQKLDEHQSQLEQISKPQKNGIACPKCHKELTDTCPDVLLASNPPQKYVHCDACGFHGYRFA